MERTVSRVPKHIREQEPAAQAVFIPIQKRNDEIGSIGFELLSLKNDCPDTEENRQRIQVLEEKLKSVEAVQLAAHQAFNQQFLSDCSNPKDDLENKSVGDLNAMLQEVKLKITELEEDLIVQQEKEHAHEHRRLMIVQNIKDLEEISDPEENQKVPEEKECLTKHLNKYLPMKKHGKQLTKELKRLQTKQETITNILKSKEDPDWLQRMVELLHQKVVEMAESSPGVPDWVKEYEVLLQSLTIAIMQIEKLQNDNKQAVQVYADDKAMTDNIQSEIQKGEGFINQLAYMREYYDQMVHNLRQ